MDTTDILRSFTSEYRASKNHSEIDGGEIEITTTKPQQYKLTTGETTYLPAGYKITASAKPVRGWFTKKSSFVAPDVLMFAFTSTFRDHPCDVGDVDVVQLEDGIWVGSATIDKICKKFAEQRNHTLLISSASGMRAIIDGRMEKGYESMKNTDFAFRDFKKQSPTIY